MSDGAKPDKKPFKGAQVLWPADMPDDMLEDAIAIAKKSLDENEFESDGVKIAEEVKKHMDKKWEPDRKSVGEGKRGVVRV